MWTDVRAHYSTKIQAHCDDASIAHSADRLMRLKLLLFIIYGSLLFFLNFEHYIIVISLYLIVIYLTALKLNDHLALT